MELGLLLLFFALVAEGTVRFIQFPKETVYYPPRGFPGKAFVCSTNASTVITWIRDDQGMQSPLNSTTFNITQVNAMTSTMYLTFDFVKASPEILLAFFDSKFFCKTATNETSNTFMFKQGALQSPTLTTPSDVRVTEGQNPPPFNCSFEVESVKPSPTVTWRFVSQSDNHSTDRRKTTSLASGGKVSSVLQLSSVTRSDAGTYQCVVKNEFGEKESSKAILTVYYFGRIESNMPDIVCVLVGKEVTLNFTVFAVPSATEIHLSRSDGTLVPLLNSSVTGNVKGVQYIKHTIVVEQIWNGTVTVYASNPFGNDTVTQAIIVLDSPGQINVIIRAISVGCSNASLVIQWTVSGNGNSQITSYTLKWRRHTDGSMQNTKTLPVADHAFLTMQGGNFTLDELESGALYSVQVEAANKLTKSQSLVKNETTFVVDKVPGRPNVTLATENIIKWTVGHSSSGYISNYTVTLNTDPNFAKENMSFTLSLLNNNHNLTQHHGMWTPEHLTSGEHYYVTVTAENCLGSNSSRVESFCTHCVLQSPFVRNVTVLRLPGERNVTFTLKTPEVKCDATANYSVVDNSTKMPISIDWHYSDSDRNLTIFISNLEEERRYELLVFQTATIINTSCFWKSLPSDDSLVIVIRIRKASSGLAGWEKAVIIIGCLCFVAGTITCIVVIVMMMMKKKKEKRKQLGPTNSDADKRETGAGTGTNKETGLNNNPETCGESTKKQTNNSTGASNKDKPESGGDNTKTGTKGQTNNTEASNKGKPESGEDTTKTGNKKQEPTYMQPEFLKEEERPPQRFPMRPVVYSKLDPKATHELQKWKQEMECELATKQDSKQENNVPGMSLSDEDFEELPDVSTSLV